MRVERRLHSTQDGDGDLGQTLYTFRQRRKRHESLLPSSSVIKVVSMLFYNLGELRGSYAEFRVPSSRS